MAPSDMERWLSLVEQRFGLACEGWQRERLARLIERWETGAGAASWGAWVGGPWEALPAALRRAIAEELTVGETYFFREAAQIEAAVGFALPARARAAAGRPLRVLSVGCSSGEEPYSIAMALAERGAGAELGEVQIHGIDLSCAAIQRARRGRYSPWSLRAAPEGALARWFHQQGEHHVIDPILRGRVTFEERNVLDPDPLFWAPGAFDVVFCRNVFIYFSDRALRAALEQLVRALAPGGFLFVAASEGIRALSNAIEPMYVGDALCYQRLSNADALAARPGPRPASPPVAPVAPAAPPSWYEAIQRSQERIAALLAADRAAEPPAPRGRGEEPGGAS